MVEAVYSELPYTEVQKHVRIHPTVGELIPTTMESLEVLA